jgi:hypothetical protein
MAVRALPQPRVRAPIQSVSVPPLVLALTLTTPATDLFAWLQPSPMLPTLGALASGFIAAALVLIWLRFPRTAWLFAACVAAIASIVMRLVGAEVAPMLSLLSVVALGVGGAFATAEVKLEAA